MNFADGFRNRGGQLNRLIRQQGSQRLDGICEIDLTHGSHNDPGRGRPGRKRYTAEQGRSNIQQAWPA